MNFFHSLDLLASSFSSSFGVIGISNSSFINWLCRLSIWWCWQFKLCFLHLLFLRLSLFESVAFLNGMFYKSFLRWWNIIGCSVAKTKMGCSYISHTIFYIALVLYIVARVSQLSSALCGLSIKREIFVRNHSFSCCCREICK